MLRSLFLILLLSLISSPCLADVERLSKEMEQEIAAMSNRMNALYGFGAAGKTLDEAYVRGGVVANRRYVNDWSNWLYIAWNDANTVYANAGGNTAKWASAVREGRFNEAEVAAVLERGRHSMRKIDRLMKFWFEDYLRVSTRRAYLSDQQQAVICCDDQYNYYSVLIEMVGFSARFPSFQSVSRLQVIQPVPKGNTIPDWSAIDHLDLERRVEDALANNDLAALSLLMPELQAALTLVEGDAADRMSAYFQQVNDALKFVQVPIDKQLEMAANTRDKTMRNKALSDVGELFVSQAVGQAGSLIEKLRSSDPKERSSIAKQAWDSLKSLSEAYDKLPGWTSSSSERTKNLKRLEALKKMYDAARQPEVSSKKFGEVVDSAGKFSSSASNLLKLLSTPSKISTKLVDRTFNAFNSASDGLNGVTRAMDGDQNGFQETKRAGRELKKHLDPVETAKAIGLETLENSLGSVPVAGSVLKKLVK